MQLAAARTSLSHPLRIDAVDIAETAGRIGMTLCPGKKGPSLFGGRWERDLEADLHIVQAWGAQALVTLLEEHEFDLLHVPHFPEAIKGRAFFWYHLPIVDGRAPDQSFETAWQRIRIPLHQILNGAGRLVVHCRGGLGRAGTVAARLLIERGMTPNEALRQVRQARPGAIETREQEAYLLERQWNHLATAQGPTIPGASE